MIPESGRSPGEGKGYPLQYPGLENSMDFMFPGSKSVGHDCTCTLTAPGRSPISSCPRGCPWDAFSAPVDQLLTEHDLMFSFIISTNMQGHLLWTLDWRPGQVDTKLTV